MHPVLPIQTNRRRLKHQSNDHFRDGHLRNHRMMTGWSPAYIANVVIFRMSKDFKASLGIDTAAEDLCFEKQCEHVRNRRRPESRKIIASLQYALDNISHFGEGVKKNKYNIVGQSLCGRRIFVAFKIVSAINATSKKDEAWIETSYFIGDKSIKDKIRKHEIRPFFSTCA